MEVEVEVEAEAEAEAEVEAWCLRPAEAEVWCVRPAAAAAEAEAEVWCLRPVAAVGVLCRRPALCPCESTEAHTNPERTRAALSGFYRGETSRAFSADALHRHRKSGCTARKRVARHDHAASRRTCRGTR